MFEFIERLRQKPDRVKKQIAFLTALFLAGIIFVVWLSVIYPDWRQTQNRDVEVKSLEPSPSGAISGTFSDGFSAISDQFKKIKEVFSSFSGSAEYYSATSSDVSE